MGSSRRATSVWSKRISRTRPPAPRRAGPGVRLRRAGRIKWARTYGAFGAKSGLSRPCAICARVIPLMEPQRAYCRRRTHRRHVLALGAILALALALRLAHWWAVREQPFFAWLAMDSQEYERWAREIAAGDR